MTHCKMSRSKRKSKACLLVREAQLHGIRRLADRQWRVFWAFALILLMWGATTNLMQFLSRFMANPTTVVRREYHRAMNAGFPAVQMYPELAFQESKVETLLENMQYPQDLNKTYIKDVIWQLAAFYKPRLAFNVGDLENIERLLNHNNLSLTEVIESLVTSCKESIIRCRWRSKVHDCSKLFHMELSDNGYCCVFNGRSLKRELNETTKPPKVKLSTRYGADTMNIGPSTGLMFVVNQSAHLVDIKRDHKRIVSTTPHRFVDSSYNHAVPISPGKELRVVYDTKLFYVSESAAKLDIGLRRCTMPDASLDDWHMKNYCTLECAMRETLRHCNCVLFTHPSPPGVPYCKASKPWCARNISSSMTAEKCNCLFTCHIDDASMSVADVTLTPYTNTYDEFYEGLDFKNVSIINVFVENRELFSKERISFFTPLDLFGQLGGLFNLYYGSSALSLYELGQLFWYSMKRWRWKRS